MAARRFAALAIALAVFLEWVIPLTILPAASVMSAVSWLGVAVAVAGLALETAAARELSGAGTTTRAAGEASALVTTGVFRWSRNPFYLGLLLVLSGAVLAFGLDWGIVTVPLVWAALDRIVVPREEAMLRARFARFDEYARRVRRWL